MSKLEVLQVILSTNESSLNTLEEMFELAYGRSVDTYSMNELKKMAGLEGVSFRM